MLRLEDLLADDEKVVRFHLHNEYFTREAIVREGNTDILKIVKERFAEYMLNRIVNH